MGAVGHRPWPRHSRYAVRTETQGPRPETRNGGGDPKTHARAQQMTPVEVGKPSRHVPVVLLARFRTHRETNIFFVFAVI